MKRTLILGFVSLFISFFINQAGAATTPPALYPIQSVSVTYNLANSTLHVQAAHPSDNWERDYVRMMTVAVNGQLVSTYNYYHQTRPDGFSDDVKLEAQVGDVITVAVYCTQGNSLSQDLTVTAAGQG